MARKGGEDRGLFERPPKSGIWWVCYFDQFGKKHRERVGTKALARKVYQKRKADIQEEKFFPGQARSRHPVSSIIDDYLKGAGAGKRSAQDDRYIAQTWKNEVGTIPLHRLAPADIERCKVMWAGEVPRSRETGGGALLFLGAWLAVRGQFMAGGGSSGPIVAGRGSGRL